MDKKKKFKKIGLKSIDYKDYDFLREVLWGNLESLFYNGVLRLNYQLFPADKVIDDGRRLKIEGYKTITYNEFIDGFLSAHGIKDTLKYNTGARNNNFSKLLISILYPDFSFDNSKKKKFDFRNIEDIRTIIGGLDNLLDENGEYIDLKNLTFKSDIFLNEIKGSVLWMNLVMFVKPNGIEKVGDNANKDATKWLVEKYLGLTKN